MKSTDARITQLKNELEELRKPIQSMQKKQVEQDSVVSDLYEKQLESMKRDLTFLEKKADDKWSQPVKASQPMMAKASSMSVKPTQMSIEVGGQAGVINQIDEDHIETLVREIVSANNMSMVTEMVRNEVE